MLQIEEITPMFTGIVTTGDKYEEDMYNDAGIIEASKGDLKTYQTVLAVGSMVRDIKVGDQVMINVMNYAKMLNDPNSVKADMNVMNKVVEWRFNWVSLMRDGKPTECLLLNDRDILYSFKGKEVQGKKPMIITPAKKSIILN